MADDTRAPRGRRASPDPKPISDTPPPKVEPTRPLGSGPKTLQKKLETMIVAIALPFKAIGDDHCANVFAQRGPVVAEAWANLAAESPAVKEVLESMLKGGAWTGAIGTTCALLIPVAAHHGAPVPPIVRTLYNAPEPRNTHSHSNPEPPMSNPNPFRVIPTDPEPRANGVPGPAAVSVKPNASPESDPRNPETYAGNISA